MLLLLASLISIGSVIAVLLWLYVSGALFALGAEINDVLRVRRGP